MTLTVDTESKTILFSGCEMSEAVHLARAHGFDGYTVKKELPATMVYGFVPDGIDVEKLQRENLGGEYLKEMIA